MLLTTACSNTSDTQEPLESSFPAESLDEPEVTHNSNVPTFPEDDIDWDSLHFKVDWEQEAEYLKNYPDAHVPNFSRAQWEALDEEGKVSREDYEAAFYRFQTCVEENGATLNYVSEIGDEFDYSLYDAYKEIVDACYEYHYSLVDLKWQVNLPPRNMTQSIENYISCLRENGHTPVHTEAITEPGEKQEAQWGELYEQVTPLRLDC